MRGKAKVSQRPALPDDYRQFAVDSMRRCLALPINHKRRRAVQLILAKAWDRLADQAEERRSRHPPSAAA